MKKKKKKKLKVDKFLEEKNEKTRPKMMIFYNFLLNDEHKISD